ncbi:MAG TPA: hypothetical protein VGY54_02485 [Polyangiaceae bacterium]|nr:hypothetical protein [Polyangiaceae bacterium]
MKPLSRPVQDPELEEFKRTIDLVEYAKRTGYEIRPSESNGRLTFLEHPRGDRIVVARDPSRQWIYASVKDYEPRQSHESPDQALQRLRGCIERAKDKGSIVEFVQQRDSTVDRGRPSLEAVRERLRAYQEPDLAFNFAAPSPQESGREPRYPRATRETVESDCEPVASAQRPSSRVDVGTRHNPDLNKRRYDWSPPPVLPPETEVEQRLRRWREAEHSMDQRLSRPAGPVGHNGPPASGLAVERRADQPLAPSPARDRQVAHAEKSPFAKRRYDWTPLSEADAAILRRLRDRSQDRGR